MPDFKGERIYVNLSASQARRRLKGFGHGVRKVQSAGRNQADHQDLAPLTRQEAWLSNVNCKTMPLQ